MQGASAVGESGERALGIIGAMEVEAAHLKAAMEDAQVVTAAGMDFHVGKLGGRNVVVVRSGVGKVDAALCVQILIDRFDVRAVVNTGVAGSLDAAINIGDLVVSTDAVQYDVDAQNFGYAPGQIPGLDTVAFKADAELRSLAVRAVHACAPEVGVFEGRVASGDQFVRDDAVKARIALVFGALCCEMEGGAIAQACSLNHVPFVILRAISDKADGSDSEDYPTFEAKAAVRCAEIVEYLARNGA